VRIVAYAAIASAREQATACGAANGEWIPSKRTRLAPPADTWPTVHLEHEAMLEVAHDTCKEQSVKHTVLRLDAMIFTENMIHLWAGDDMSKLAVSNPINFTMTFYVRYLVIFLHHFFL